MITVTPDTFRLARTFPISRGSKTEARVLTVRITRGGVTGWGECVPYARYGETVDSVTAQIAALPDDVTPAALQTALPPGAARNAVDCALWDLEAKTTGQRVWHLAGLATPGPKVVTYTLSLDTPEAMRAQLFGNRNFMSAVVLPDLLAACAAASAAALSGSMPRPGRAGAAAGAHGAGRRR